MGEIVLENVIGYRLSGLVVCAGCITEDESCNASEDDIITSDDTEESLFFCDRCRKKM